MLSEDFVDAEAGSSACLSGGERDVQRRNARHCEELLSLVGRSKQISHVSLRARLAGGDLGWKLLVGEHYRLEDAKDNGSCTGGVSSGIKKMYLVLVGQLDLTLASVPSTLSRVEIKIISKREFEELGLTRCSLIRDISSSRKLR